MTTTDTDHLTVVRTVREAIRIARTAMQDPQYDIGPEDLQALYDAVKPVPVKEGSHMEDSKLRADRILWDAVRDPLFDVLPTLRSAVAVATEDPPSWTPVQAMPLTIVVNALIHRCYAEQPDPEGHEDEPWVRAAAAGLDLLSILMRRTDLRPADRGMQAAARTFADLLTYAVAGPAIRAAGSVAEAYALRYLDWSMSLPVRTGPESWARRLRHTIHRFALIPPNPLYPHGAISVRRNGDERHVFALTARTPWNRIRSLPHAV
ncbi:hypothetical protein [Streptomyces sp. NPDC097619]|uniref:hypothetical protein n=1 Tax=Streptomyces sp. NPDC097619 TaxID=3157228 RepID=UPI003332515F